VNMAKNGDHYWVFAHVTPSFDDHGKIIGYHSNRRVVRPEAIEKVKPLYAKLREIEDGSGNARDGLASAEEFLVNTLKDAGVPYDEFVFSL